MQITKYSKQTGNKYTAISKPSGEVVIQCYALGHRIGGCWYKSADDAYDNVGAASHMINQADREFSSRLALLVYATLH